MSLQPILIKLGLQGEDVSGEGKEEEEDRDNLAGRRRSILEKLSLRRKKEVRPIQFVRARDLT